MTTDFASRQRFEHGPGRCAQGRGGGAPRAAPRSPPRRASSACCSRSAQEEKARLQQARANLRLAQNDLDNTVIRAPVAGIAGNRAGQVGQYVKPGTELLSLVPLPRVYVTANFKETQLTRMRPGQRAEVSVDAYPDHAAHRPDRQLRAGERRRVQPAAARQRDRQFHQDRAARAGAHRVAERTGRSPGCCGPGLSVTVTVDTRDEGEASRRPTASSALREAKPAAPSAPTSTQ